MIWITTIVLCLKAFPGLHQVQGNALETTTSPGWGAFLVGRPRGEHIPLGKPGHPRVSFHWKQSSCFPSNLPGGHISEHSGGTCLTTVAWTGWEKPVSTFSGL